MQAPPFRKAEVYGFHIQYTYPLPLSPPPAGNDDERVCEGARNDSLFRAGMGMAKQFRDYETLRQAMLTLNSSFSPPLALDEAQHVVERVWFYQTTGRNFSGSEACAVISRDEILSFPDDHSLRLLLLLKQAHTVRPEPFAISQPEVAELLGIHQSRMPGLIRKLIKTGHIVKVHQGTGRGNPCFYQLSATKNGSLTLASMAPSSRIASG